MDTRTFLTELRMESDGMKVEGKKKNEEEKQYHGKAES
jgi:hypothetical protein